MDIISSNTCISCKTNIDSNTDFTIGWKVEDDDEVVKHELHLCKSCWEKCKKPGRSPKPRDIINSIVMYNVLQSKALSPESYTLTLEDYEILKALGLWKAE
ncbi:MAG: hypothetical protein ABSA16_12300 [Thermoguttaceae bacterium]|jgi:hypothetical protein